MFTKSLYFNKARASSPMPPIISKAGFNNQCGLLVNSSRQIIYAGSNEDFALKAGEEARKVQQEMELLLVEADLL